MRSVVGALLLLSTAGCPSSGTGPAPFGDAGRGGPVGGGGGDAGGLVFQPATSACDGGLAQCLSGTAVIDPLISAKWTSWKVALYRLYPAGGEQRIDAQFVAKDDTWAFSGVGADAGAPGAHYYVQAVATYAGDGGQPAAAAVVGPLSVPASNVAITLRPMQATALESRAVGGSMQLDWVLARLFDPAGAEITSGAQVSVLVGGAAIPLASTALGASGQAYFVQFATPQPAQPTYTVTASHPAFGDAGLSAHIFADPPPFDGTITSVDGGSDGALTVSWTAQPQADYEVVELYAATQDGGWASAPAFVSPRPDPPDQTAETFGAVDAGTYLVNVSYTKANCPADAGGCVQASTVAATTVTVP